MSSTALVFVSLIAITLIVLSLVALRPRFKAKPILNRSERRLFWEVQQIMNRVPGRYLVCPQVSYGEILSSSRTKAFWSINARRADIVICDYSFSPRAVIEYQGSGHYGRNRRERIRAKRGDRLKRRALASAGIPMIEVEPSYRIQDLEHKLVSDLAARDH